MLQPSVVYSVGGSERVVQPIEVREEEEGHEVRVTEVGSSQ